MGQINFIKDLIGKQIKFRSFIQTSLRKLKF
jgi:hypothetical protein